MKNIIQWLLLPVWLPLLFLGVVFGMLGAVAGNFLTPQAVMNALGWLAFTRRQQAGRARYR